MFNSIMNDQKMTTPIHDTQIKNRLVTLILLDGSNLF